MLNDGEPTFTYDHANRLISLNKYNYGLSNPITLTDPSGKDPISQCLAALGTGVIIDGPFIPVGDAVGLGACLIILLTAGYSALVSLYYADEVADILEDVCTLPRVRERIYNDERIEGEYGPVIWRDLSPSRRQHLNPNPRPRRLIPFRQSHPRHRDLLGNIFLWDLA